MENYKEKYEKLANSEWFKKIYHDKSLGECPIVIDELEETEDEKIRKSIIELVKQSSHILNPMNQKSMIAWLEKQGEQKLLNNDKYQTVSVKILDRLYESEKELERLKKGEQKPTDKVEPKFKVGNWAAIKEEIGLCTPLHIVDMDDKQYRVEQIDGSSGTPNIDYLDRLYHLWTIEDAKDGDVLYHKSPLNGIEYVVMSRGVNSYGNVDSYFRYNSEDGFGISVPSVFSAKCDSITPATKEQRDLLFQKMKEAGYEWDAEKKELRKIEQPKLTEFENAIKDMMDDYRDAIDDNEATVEEVKEKAAYLLSLIHCKPTWCEEDEEYLIDAIKYLELFDAQGIHGDVAVPCINWLKSLKDRVQPQPNQEWSREDERHRKRIVERLEDIRKSKEDNIDVASVILSEISWLKSLKPQPYWKPSEEQKQALE